MDRQRDYKIVFDIATYAYAASIIAHNQSMETMSTNLALKFRTVELTVACSRTIHSFQPSETHVVT